MKNTFKIESVKISSGESKTFSGESNRDVLDIKDEILKNNDMFEVPMIRQCTHIIKFHQKIMGTERFIERLVIYVRKQHKVV